MTFCDRTLGVNNSNNCRACFSVLMTVDNQNETHILDSLHISCCKRPELVVWFVLSFPITVGNLVYFILHSLHWSRCLIRWFAVNFLLGFLVRIPLKHGCLSVVSVVCCQVEVCCECCVLSGRGLL